MRTFRGVVKHFKEVFAELVPQGSATMSIVTTHDVAKRASAAAERKSSGGGKTAKSGKKKGRTAAAARGSDADDDAMTAAGDDEEEDDGGADAADGLVLDGEGEGEEGDDDEEEYGGVTASRAKAAAAAAKRKSGGATAGGAAAGGAAALTRTSSVAEWAADLETFAGLAVAVSFTAGGESKDMKRLSGGQKALVALAIIFAIQVGLMGGETIRGKGRSTRHHLRHPGGAIGDEGGDD